MKRCKKSSPEPPCLATFRNTNSSATWNEFRGHDAGECYNNLRSGLIQDQGGLCAYCEINPRDQNQQIAHFHPKSDTGGSTNWALNWSNLWLACKGGSQTWMVDSAEHLPPLPENLSCDEVKGNEILDGKVLAPDDIPDFPRIFRFEQHHDVINIMADEDQCRFAGIPIEKVNNTIDAFNLNCRRLGKARLAVHRKIEAQIKALRERSNTPREHFRLLIHRFFGKDSDGSWRRFFTLARWRFGRHAENFLSEIGYQG